MIYILADIMVKLAISKTCMGCQRFERGEAISVLWL